MPGTPVSWISSVPYRGISKPGKVVHVSYLRSGPGMLPSVGTVRGIFVDDQQQTWVRVKFPSQFGDVGTYHVSEVTGHWTDNPPQSGDWNALYELYRVTLQRRREAGLPEPTAIYPDAASLRHLFEA